MHTMVGTGGNWWGGSFNPISQFFPKESVTRVDMLASFPGSFPSLAVRVESYCKQREAGRGFQGYRCSASDTSITLLTETWQYFFAAVSSMHQHCRTLVVNYFRCTFVTLPVRSGPGFNGGH